MNSTLKIGLPLALIVIVIFGVTLISQNVGETISDDSTQAETNAGKFSGPPLLIPSTEIGYNPTAPDIESRSFPGFYELDKTAVPVSFWFKNVHQTPVRMQVLARGCTTCTQARVGILEPASFDKAVQQAVVGALPVSPFGAFNLLPSLAASEAASSMKWQDFELDGNLNKIVEIPAARGPDQPTLGVFQMAISVISIGPSDRRFVTVRAGVEGGIPAEYTFRANMIGVQPFELLEQAIKVPPMDEGAESKTYTIMALSATRKLPSDYGSLLPFNPPTATVNPPDPFFEVSTAVTMTPEEVAQARNFLMATKKVVPLKCGYKMQVTIHRQRPGQTPSEPDIGPFNRDVAISSPGMLHTPTFNISGTFQGLVSLTEGTVLDLKDFPGKVGTTLNTTLVSDKSDVQLSWSKAETKPDFLDVKLSEPRLENGRRFWTLSVIVPPGRLTQPVPFGSFVVLNAKLGDTVRKIRLPLKGVGSAR